MELTLQKFLSEYLHEQNTTNEMNLNQKDFSSQSTFNEIYGTKENKLRLVSLLKQCARQMLKSGPKKNFELLKVIDFLNSNNYR